MRGLNAGKMSVTRVTAWRMEEVRVFVLGLKLTMSIFDDTHGGRY